jgi:hypothetical protein
MLNLFNSMNQSKPDGTKNDSGAQKPMNGDMMKLLDGFDKDGSMKNMMGLFNMLPNMMKRPDSNTPKETQKDTPERNSDYEAYHARPHDNASSFQTAAARESRIHTRRNPQNAQTFQNPSPAAAASANGSGSENTPRSSYDQPDPNRDVSDENGLQYINTAPKYKNTRRRNNVNYRKYD